MARKIKNLSIAKKILSGFIVTSMIAAIVGFVGIYNLLRISSLDSELYEHHTATMPYLADIARYYQAQTATLRDLYMEKQQNFRQKYIDQYMDQSIILSDNMKKFGETIEDQKVRDLYDQLSIGLNDFEVFSQETVAFVSAGDLFNAYNLLTSRRAAEISNRVQAATDELITYKTNVAKYTADHNAGASLIAIIVSLVVLLGGIGAAVFLGIIISNSISKPIAQMVRVADSIALGDIDVEIESDSNDEVGSLAEAFGRMIFSIREQTATVKKIANGDLTVDVAIRSDKDILGINLADMVHKMNSVILSIASASAQVAVGSDQVSDTSASLSTGAAEQAGALEELTASMQEVTVQTQKTSVNAGLANEFAQAAKDNAVQGQSSMVTMMRAMDAIQQASTRISKITKAIDDIAFQTNILALNAAVEAARAGQYGKGFTVVAEEVRNLAIKSSEAAKQTENLVESCVAKTDEGISAAQSASDTLNEIVQKADKTASYINNVASACKEQDISIGQINQGIMEVSRVVLTNSAISEEAAATSAELTKQAAQLKTSIDSFQIRNGEDDNLRLTADTDDLFNEEDEACA